MDEGQLGNKYLAVSPPVGTPTEKYTIVFDPSYQHLSPLKPVTEQISYLHVKTECTICSNPSNVYAPSEDKVKAEVPIF